MILQLIIYAIIEYIFIYLVQNLCIPVRFHTDDRHLIVYVMVCRISNRWIQYFLKFCAQSIEVNNKFIIFGCIEIVYGRETGGPEDSIIAELIQDSLEISIVLMDSKSLHVSDVQKSKNKTKLNSYMGSE